MKIGFIAAALLAGALALTGCGKGENVEGKDITGSSSAKDVGTAYINEMTRIADALETVNDEESARKAAATIKVAAEGLESMGTELEGDMDPMKAMQVFGGRYQELIEVQSRIATSMMRIQNDHPELVEVISAETDRLGN